MPRRPVGPVWIRDDLRITVVPDPRAPGRWLCKLRGARGERTQQQFASEAEAHAQAQTLLATMREREVEPPPAQKTVSELIDRYVRTRAVLNPTRRASTGLAQAHAFGFIRAAWGDRPPSVITRDGILDWLATLRKPPHGTGRLAQTSVQRVFRTFRQVLGSAADLGVPNPLVTLRVAAERERPQEPWTPVQLRAILAAAREHWARDPQYVFGLWLWMQSGLRAGEVLALRVNDLDVAAGTVRVDESYSQRELGPPKVARKRPAFIVLPTLAPGAEWRPGATAESWGVLDWYEQQMRVRTLHRPDAFLCGATPDRPWSHDAMHGGWGAILARLGLPYREPEVLRHTMAALLLSRGAPTAFVTDQGGWKSIEVVERVYARYMPSVFNADPRPVARPEKGAALLPQQLTTRRQPSGKSAKTQTK